MANFTNPHMFNIVLNSQQSSASSTGTNDEIYLFNWTNIPRGGKYKMAWSYLGKNNGDYVANDCPQVFLTVTSVPSVYQANGTSSSNISTYIGSLRAQTHGAGQVNYYCNTFDNPEVFFNNPPSNGDIRVRILKDDFTTPFLTTAGSPIADYVLVLSFHSIE
jgi:hypothetical protein